MVCIRRNMICVVREDSEDDLCKEENNLSHQGRWICVSKEYDLCKEGILLFA